MFNIKYLFNLTNKKKVKCLLYEIIIILITINYHNKMNSKNKSPYYQHKYGGVYLYLGKIINKTDDQELIHYKHIYPFEESEAVRSYYDFGESFKNITEEEYHNIKSSKSTEEFQQQITEDKNKQKQEQKQEKQEQTQEQKQENNKKRGIDIQDYGFVM